MSNKTLADITPFFDLKKIEGIDVVQSLFRLPKEKFHIILERDLHDTLKYSYTDKNETIQLPSKKEEVDTCLSQMVGITVYGISAREIKLGISLTLDGWVGSVVKCYKQTYDKGWIVRIDF